MKTILFVLLIFVNFCIFSQDTIRYENHIDIFSNNKIMQRLFYINEKQDIKIIYNWKDDVLKNITYYRKDKKISTLIVE